MGARDNRLPSRAYDGLARCALCSSELAAGHSWCGAAHCLACDDCCRALVTGDPSRVLSMLMGPDGDLGIQQMLDACSECPRLPKRLAEESPQEGTDAEQPLLN